ncbi:MULTISPECIES: HlyD family secretion protein [unclassified Sphingomonas]|uniref:HlyD family secretion protein n=1 Tax=unclassified Sphingomonas TaxID=196159 RepID=UPI000E73D751|nr:MULTISPECIES: HlyD family secretion protein [unclassified Sphingomonas]RKE50032.1 membrane fusion protein (multidrug efflux system) [Sphingomonas sp. PP-CC-1A-547]TCM08364.1 membrane fusion protein (multidrug efflux system) [Sphingomonas sp. PP-CC-3G-468]
MTDQNTHSDTDHDEDRKDDPNGEDQQSDNDQQGDSDEDKADGDDKKPSVFKKPLFWIILVIVVGGLIIGGVLYWLYARQFESTDDAFVDTHIVRLAPQVAGTLVQVADIDNRHVEAGRLLAVIKASGRDAQVAEAQANESQARAQFAQAQAQVTAAEAQRQQAAAQARVPMAAAVKAQQDLARYEALLRLDPSAVAGQQLDQARATARQTAADAAAAREQIDTATAQISVARKQVGAAKSVIDARRAQVDQANVTIGDLRLTAPVAGQVVNRSVNVGSYVAPGTQLMAIVPDTMWVTANFKETQLTLMKIGQPVEIHVDAYPGVDFKGHVDSIQRGAGQAFALLPPQNATGNYVKVVQRVPVRIVFDAKNGPDPKRYPIGPGMSVVPTVKVR